VLELATVEELIAWTGEPALLPRVTFGQHRGCKWDEPRRTGFPSAPNTMPNSPSSKRALPSAPRATSRMDSSRVRPIDSRASLVPSWSMGSATARATSGEVRKHARGGDLDEIVVRLHYSIAFGCLPRSPLVARNETVCCNGMRSRQTGGTDDSYTRRRTRRIVCTSQAVWRL
jgi:hypothetical protein